MQTENIVFNGTLRSSEALSEEENSIFKTLTTERMLHLVLYFHWLPWIVNRSPWTIKQDESITVICSLLSYDTLREALTGYYGIWISQNIYSIERPITSLISTMRGKAHGVRIKEWFVRRENILAKLYSYFTLLLAKHSERFFLAYSQRVVTFLLRHGFDEEKIYHIPKYCRDYSTISYDEEKLKRVRAKYFSEDKANLLFVGRLVPFKGLDILLQALDGNDQVHLVVVGDDRGSYAEECKELAESLDVDVTFAGQVGKEKGSDKVVYYYCNADLFVLPNKYCPNEFEPVEIWGSVVDEALFLELPVIVTTVTGCAEDLVLDKDVGRIVEEGSVQELRKAIQDYLDNPEKWKKKGKKGPAVVREKNRKNIAGWKQFLADIGEQE